MGKKGPNVRTMFAKRSRVSGDDMGEAIKRALQEKPLTATALTLVLRSQGISVSNDALSLAAGRLVEAGEIVVKRPRTGRGKGSGRRFHLADGAAS